MHLFSHTFLLRTWPRCQPQTFLIATLISKMKLQIHTHIWDARISSYLLQAGNSRPVCGLSRTMSWPFSDISMRPYGKTVLLFASTSHSFSCMVSDQWTKISHYFQTWLNYNYFNLNSMKSNGNNSHLY